MADTKPDSITELPEDPAQLRSQLDDLVAQATAKYAVKDYREAAELYSQSTELQTTINGEMSTDNADLYYLYGRCLYHVAVQNSDVLGAKVAGEKAEEKKSADKSKSTKGGAKAGPSTSAEQSSSKAEEAVAAVAQEKDGQPAAAGGSVPFFQFSGDDNWVEGSDEEDEGDAEEAPVEEEDDFSNAFEMLDLARVLLQRKLEATEQNEGSSKEGGSGPEAIKAIKERLADTYDLQAEISLENEQFPQAAADLRSGLELKTVLFPLESSLLAEAHYKLSLALEFSSVTQQKDEEGNVKEGQAAHVDEAMREEAAKEMEAAIASCKARIEKEEAILKESQADGAKKTKVTRESIDDVKDMVQDMEQRLVELRQPPVSVNDPLGTGSTDGATPLQGILGQILGESPEAQKARLEEASKGAKDLTGLVKKKKPDASAGNGNLAPETAANGNGKRKADDEDVSSETSKKARVEDTDE